jgi:hypothetical protein
MEFTRKVRPNMKNKLSSLSVTIPPELVEAYGIKPHDLVTFDLLKVIKKEL